MVEVFLIRVEAPDSGKAGYLSQKTRKTDEGIKVEYLSEIQENNPEADISNVVAYYTRRPAENTRQLILDEVEARYPGRAIVVNVEPKQVSLADSQTISQNQWSYK
jgi:hypothetical protein